MLPSLSITSVKFPEVKSPTTAAFTHTTVLTARLSTTSDSLSTIKISKAVPKNTKQFHQFPFWVYKQKK